MKTLTLLLIAALFIMPSCEKIDPVDPVEKEAKKIVLNKKSAEIIQADQQFAFELFKEVHALSEEDNLMISPLSVSYALGMTYNGSAGDTREAFREVLHFGEWTDQEVNESYKDLMSQLVTLDDAVQLSIANSIWYRLGFEVLEGFGGRIPFNLEIKTSEKTGRYSGIEAAALAAIEERGLLETTLFSCFDDSVLEELRRIAAEARIGVLVSPREPREPLAQTLARAGSVAAEAINPHFVMVDEALMGAAHDQGLAVYVYTVDAEPEMERLLDLGVDGIFTNHPRRLRAVVDGRA